MQLKQHFDNKDALIRYVIKNYHALRYLPQLRQLLSLMQPEEDVNCLCKFELHRGLNNALMGKYAGEQEIKHALFEEFCKKDLVAAFEINVQSSRLDFLTINGVTTSYEIKSSLDNLGKLQKQSAAYLRAFEFNNIVIAERHLKNVMNIVPIHFGIHTFFRGKMLAVRAAIHSNELDPAFQLGLLTKKELISAFGTSDQLEILLLFNCDQINANFKETLKSRYLQRWQFIVSRADQILPLDIQFFFNSNVEPNHIYSMN